MTEMTEMTGRMGSVLGGLVAFGFPSPCLVCRAPLEWPLKGPICDPCWRSMPVIQPPYCPRCGMPYEMTVAAGLCGPCRPQKGARRRRFRRARAVGRYDGSLKETLLSLKYAGRARLAAALGRLAFRALVATGELDAGAAVVPVPLHWRRRRERGYNQAELLGGPLPEPPTDPAAAPSSKSRCAPRRQG